MPFMTRSESNREREGDNYLIVPNKQPPDISSNDALTNCESQLYTVNHTSAGFFKCFLTHP